MTINDAFIQSVRNAIKNGNFNVNIPSDLSLNDAINIFKSNGLSITSIDNYLDGTTNISFTAPKKIGLKSINDVRDDG